MFRKHSGFTLIEILVALFIFAILSVMMADGLHRLITVQGETDKQASRLREIQFAMVRLNNDIALTIDRPITDAQGKTLPSFHGTPERLEFTRTGGTEAANQQSILMRVAYEWHDNKLWRETWPTLDRAENTVSHKQFMLSDVTDCRLEYLDVKNEFHAGWPQQSQLTQTLPRAVRITCTLNHLGKLSQTIALNAENNTLEASHAPKP